MSFDDAAAGAVEAAIAYGTVVAAVVVVAVAVAVANSCRKQVAAESAGRCMMTAKRP